ncbi:hypothetical protein BpHYR1_009701, partial [Brachionus plicatilis]
ILTKILTTGTQYTGVFFSFSGLQVDNYDTLVEITKNFQTLKSTNLED